MSIHSGLLIYIVIGRVVFLNIDLRMKVVHALLGVTVEGAILGGLYSKDQPTEVGDTPLKQNVGGFTERDGEFASSEVDNPIKTEKKLNAGTRLKLRSY